MLGLSVIDLNEHTLKIWTEYKCAYNTYNMYVYTI